MSIRLVTHLEPRRALVVHGDLERVFEVDMGIAPRWPEVVRSIRPQDRLRQALALREGESEHVHGTRDARAHLLRARAWLLRGGIDADRAAGRRAVELHRSAAFNTRTDLSFATQAPAEAPLLNGNVQSFSVAVVITVR